MSSPFIGLQVNLTLHSQRSPIKAKIISIDPGTNTLTIQEDDGSRSVLNRTDIASLAAYTPPIHDSPQPKSAHLVPGQVLQSPKSAQPSPAPTDTYSPKPQPKTTSAAKPTFVDPAIMSFTRSDELSTPTAFSSPGSVPHRHQPHNLANSLSRSSTPSQSPRPKSATVSSKASRKKANPISRSSSPAVAPNRETLPSSTEEFDFGAGLAAFDKKRIWDEIRSSDNTDPASLLVSHNRIANGPTALVRGPNGVGPANAAPILQNTRGRASLRDGQQKLRPNEMVCSPSPERPHPSSSDDVSPGNPQTAVPFAVATAQAHSVKPSYEDLENKIGLLETELALVKRRNVLLEELAGLGRGYKAEQTQLTAPAPQALASPSQEVRISSPSVQVAVADRAVLASARGINSLSLQPASLKTSASTPDGMRPTPSSVSEPEKTPANPSLSPSATPAARSMLKDPFFGHVVDAPVLTLLFPTAAIQHASLARMEAFYESDSSSKQYLNLSQARDERICRNYQGFNFPIEQGVKHWLAAMWDATATSSEHASSTRWWEPQCSDEENTLLDLLVEIGAISNQEAYQGTTSGNQGIASISYVISSIASQANSTLPHELLHALYFLSPSYRSFVTAQWSSLSAPSKKVIETDLSLRKYAPSVYEDEFQAYLAEGPATEKEFGNKPAAECRIIGQQLRERTQQEWARLGFSPQGKESLWEDAKWDTLDRYAAYQKALKKTSKLAGAALPKKAKK